MAAALPVRLLRGGEALLSVRHVDSNNSASSNDNPRQSQFAVQPSTAAEGLKLGAEAFRTQLSEVRDNFVNVPQSEWERGGATGLVRAMAVAVRSLHLLLPHMSPHYHLRFPLPSSNLFVEQPRPPLESLLGFEIRFVFLIRFHRTNLNCYHPGSILSSNLHPRSIQKKRRLLRPSMAPMNECAQEKDNDCSLHFVPQPHLIPR